MSFYILKAGWSIIHSVDGNVIRQSSLMVNDLPLNVVNVTVQEGDFPEWGEVLQMLEPFSAEAQQQAALEAEQQQSQPSALYK